MWQRVIKLVSKEYTKNNIDKSCIWYRNNQSWFILMRTMQSESSWHIKQISLDNESYFLDHETTHHDENI